MHESRDLPSSLTHLNKAAMQSYLLGMYHIYNVKHAEQMKLSAMVAHAKRGNAEAQEQMYRTFAPKMRATCKRVMKREMPAIDDLLHDAFVLTYTSLDQLKEPDTRDTGHNRHSAKQRTSCRDRLDTQAHPHALALPCRHRPSFKQRPAPRQD